MNSNMRIKWCFLSVFGLISVSIYAGNEDRALLQEAVRNLGARSFKTREEASFLLWEKGGDARDLLREATQLKDPEISMRAADILRKIRLGIFPDTPGDLLLKLLSFDSSTKPEKLQIIVDLMGDQDSGWRSLERLLVSLNEEERGSNLFATICRIDTTKNFLLRLIKASPKWDGLIENFLKALALDGVKQGRYVCWSIINGKLEERIAELEKKTDSLGKDICSLRLLAMMYKAAGRLEEASQTAEQGDIYSASYSTALERGDYKRALDVYTSDLEPTYDKSKRLALIGTLANWAGNREVYEDTTLRLIQEINASGEGYCHRIVQYFIINQRFEDLKQFMLARKYGGFFEMRLLPFDYIQLNEARLSVGGLASDDYIEFLFFHGERKRAHALIDNKFSTALINKDYTSAGYALVKALETESPHLESYVQRAVEIEDFCFDDISESLCEDLIWFTYFRLRYPEDDSRTRFARVREWLTTCRERSKKVEMLEYIDQNIGRFPEEDHLPIREDLCNAYLQLGIMNKNFEQLRKIYDLEQTCKNLLAIADGQIRNGDLIGAISTYEKGAEGYPRCALMLYLHGKALLDLGRKDEGKEKIRIAILLPIIYDWGWFDLADGLTERGYTQEAYKCYKLASVPWWQFGHRRINSYREMSRLAGELGADKDYFVLANYHRAADVACFAGNVGYLDQSKYFIFASEYHLLRAEGHFARREFNESLQEYIRAFNLNGGNIDRYSEAISRFENVGMIKEAGTLYDIIKQRYVKLLELLPRSLDIMNSLAWFMARTGREIDKAYNYSMHVVSGKPKEAEYLDTMAEICFRMKKREESIDWQKKAVKFAGEDEKLYMQERLQHFQNADIDAY